MKWEPMQAEWALPSLSDHLALSFSVSKSSDVNGGECKEEKNEVWILEKKSALQNFEQSVYWPLGSCQMPEYVPTIWVIN